MSQNQVASPKSVPIHLKYPVTMCFSVYSLRVKCSQILSVIRNHSSSNTFKTNGCSFM